MRHYSPKLSCPHVSPVSTMPSRRCITRTNSTNHPSYGKIAIESKPGDMEDHRHNSPPQRKENQTRFPNSIITTALPPKSQVPSFSQRRVKCSHEPFALSLSLPLPRPNPAKPCRSTRRMQCRLTSRWKVSKTLSLLRPSWIESESGATGADLSIIAMPRLPIRSAYLS